MADLETASLDELIDELFGRSKCAVVLAILDPKVNGDEQDFKFAYAGGFTQAMGCVARATACMAAKAADATGHVSRDVEED